MPTCKCKMCGGQIKFDENETTAICEFCDTEQTVICTNDLKKAGLFNRANTLRLSNDFDSALQIYESILINDPKNAEAHWGICLCRYGIEYVNDPSTGKKFPTCHRTIFNSIFNDIDYKDTISNCDVLSRKIYQAEAEEIDKIQKNILSLSQKEDPYDIFICYKETDEFGDRTKDSVIAQEIYDSLIEQGYKVFFSRITLESKLGSQYEPIIFAALQSSKIMLVIGSKEEYFNSTWVKNEWSRYLSFMKETNGKYLIPCYKDMEAYEMPKEFLSLQAQNIDKLGFLQDLIYGINKIFGKRLNKVESVIPSNNVNKITNKYNNLLIRIKLLIEDKDYKKAESLIEKILNENAQCSEAYICLMLIELGLSKEEDLLKLNYKIESNRNFQKALRFADFEYKNKLLSYNEKINRNIELKEKEKKYVQGKKLYEQKYYSDAVSVLQRISDYKDSKILIDKANEYIDYNRKEKIFNDEVGKIKNVLYYKKINDDVFNHAIEKLNRIQDFENTKEVIEKYKQEYDSLKKSIQEAERLRLQKQKEALEKRKIRIDRFKRFLKFFIPSFIVIISLIIVTIKLFIPLSKYYNALDLITQGYYDDARVILIDLDDFKDSSNQIVLMESKQKIEDGYYIDSINLVCEIGGEVNITYNPLDGATLKLNETINSKNLNGNSFHIDNLCSKDGYKFKEWTVEKYDYNLKNYNLDLTLQANYTPINYNVLLDLNGGTFNSSLNINYNIESDDINVPNPTKTGYSFIGWTNNESNKPIKDLIISKGNYGNKTYTANWEKNTYTITYVWNDEYNTSTTQKVLYKDDIELLNPSFIGHTFIGWCDENNKYFDDTKYNYDKNITLYAKWDGEIFDISYDLNGGMNNLENPYTYTYDSNDIILKHPIREGYTFLGWTEEESDSPILNLTIPNKSVGNKKFVANWEANTYTITYDVNGGIDLENNLINVKFGEDFILETPKREGYEFVYWMLEGKLFTSSIYNVSKDITIVAKWEIIYYSISYKLDGGTNSKLNPSTYTYEDEDINIVVPSKEGYTFLGWTSTELDVPTKNYIIKNNTIDDLILVAKWSVNTYKITYDVNEGNELSSNIQIVTYDGNYELAIPTRNGYTFFGWYSDGELISITGVWKKSYDLIITASWLVNRYNIEIINDLNNENKAVIYGYNFELDYEEKENYQFNGYYIEKNGEGIQITNDKGYCLEPYNFENDITVYGYYTYDVSFITNGGTAVDSITYKQNDYLESSVVATKDGKTFGGWYFDFNLTKAVPYDSSIGNTTLYAKWEEEVSPTDLEYTETNEGITITNSTYSGTDLIIPSHINDIEVVSIGKNAFENMTNLVQVEVPNTINTIGLGAFINCNSIVNITIPFIGASEEASDYNAVFGYIFGYLTSRESNYSYTESTNFINNKKTSSYFVWQYSCYNYENYHYYLNNYFYYIPTTIKEVIVTKQINIPVAAFNNCSFIEKITLPSETESIGEYAFQDCSSLKQFNSEEDGLFKVPSAIININKYSFYNCSNIIKFMMGNNVISIGDYAFYNCSNLNGFEFPDTIDDMGTYAFYGCSSLESIVIPNNITTIESYCFSKCISLETIVIPENVTTINSYAFSECNSLEEIIIPSSIIYIGSSVLSGCVSLKSLTLPFVGDSIKTSSDTLQYPFGYIFGSNSYSNCDYTYQCFYGNSLTNTTGNGYYIPSSLKEVTILDGCINYGAFYNCSNIETINLPKGISKIGKHAFYNCSSLENVYYNDDLEDWCNIEFANEYSNPMYYADHFFMLDIDDKYYEVTEIEIPNSIIKIESYTFCGFDNLNKVSMPYCVEVIESWAFYNCNGMIDLTLPQTITSMGFYSTYNCTSLENVYYNGTIEDWCNISFASNSNPMYYANHFFMMDIDNKYYEVTEIEIPDTINKINYYTFFGFANIKKVIISDSVKTIGISAFRECLNLEEIVLSNKITNIDQYAFYQCVNLTRIYYTGNIEDSYSATIGTNNDCFLNANKLFYSEIEILDSDYKYWYYDEEDNICIWE